MAAMLLGFGCNSTLTEYQCEVAADCIGDMVGRCEPSGHCSFEDERCVSGFRFGSKSGSESDLCVGDDGTIPPQDAGPQGAPIARIEPFSLPCGQTNGQVSGLDSEAFDNKTLVEFSWRLLGQNGDVIDEFSGPPGAPIVQEIHHQGGTYARPVVNATTYHGQKALRVEVASAPPDNGPTLQQSLSLLFPPAATADFLLTFALGGTSNTTGSGSVRIVDSLDTIITSEILSIGPGMQPYRFFYPDLAQGGLFPPISIHFRFGSTGTFFVDNVSLVALSNGSQLVSNGSVEEGAEPWVFGDATLEAAQAKDIPESIRQPGVYDLILRVIDSSDVVSAPAELPLVVAECLPGSPAP